MEKNKKIWIFAPTMIVTPIVACSLFNAFFVAICLFRDCSTIEFDLMIFLILVFLIIPFFVTTFIVLW